MKLYDLAIKLKKYGYGYRSQVSLCAYIHFQLTLSCTSGTARSGFHTFNAILQFFNESRDEAS